MTVLTGTIIKVAPKNAFCHIQTPDGKRYFAFHKAFGNPALMKEGATVRFLPKEMPAVKSAEVIAA